MDRTAVFQRIKEIGIIPALRSSDPDRGVSAAGAILAGGIPIVEVSMAYAAGIKVLDALVHALGDRMVLGAGTVTDPEEARVAREAGAQFVVTPGFSAEVCERCSALGMTVFAGAITPTEVQLASKSGADAVKLFPCYSMGGARYLRSLTGQYPKVEFIASCGISLERCTE